MIDDPELVLYPVFNDRHNHQLLAARDLDYVSLEQARSVDELVQALRGAADRTPPGEWVISSRCWHETHLREGRLLGEERSVGILAPGAFADVVGFRTDLLDCPVDDLPSRQPALTLVGGRPVHDPDGLLGSAGAPAPASFR